jgi:hypothetical protein
MIQTATIVSKSSYLRLFIDGVELDVQGSSDLLVVLASIYRRHRREGKRRPRMVHGLRLRLLYERGVVAANELSASERIIRAVADRNGRHVVRAAALQRDGRALLIAGSPGSGKSTIAVNLLASGWKLLADNYVLLSADGTTAFAHQALMAFPARSTPHIPSCFRKAIEHSRWYSADGGQDLRFYEVDPTVVFGPNVWSDRAQLDAIVLLTPSGSESRVRTIDGEHAAETLRSSIPDALSLSPQVRVGAIMPSHATHCADLVDTWFDAHVTRRTRSL